MKDGAAIFSHETELQIAGVLGGGNACFEEAIGDVVWRAEVAAPAAIVAVDIDGKSTDKVGRIGEENE
jgi:hypothetical protein